MTEVVMINMWENYESMGIISDIERTQNVDGRSVLRFFLNFYNTDGKRHFHSKRSCIMFDNYADKREKDLKNGDFVIVSGAIRDNDKLRSGYSIKVNYIKHIDPIYRDLKTVKGGE